MITLFPTHPHAPLENTAPQDKKTSESRQSWSFADLISISPIIRIAGGAVLGGPVGAGLAALSSLAEAIFTTNPDSGEAPPPTAQDLPQNLAPNSPQNIPWYLAATTIHNPTPQHRRDSKDSQTELRIAVGPPPWYKVALKPTTGPAPEDPFSPGKTGDLAAPTRTHIHHLLENQDSPPQRVQDFRQNMLNGLDKYYARVRD